MAKKTKGERIALKKLAQTEVKLKAAKKVTFRKHVVIIIITAMVSFIITTYSKWAPIAKEIAQDVSSKVVEMAK